MIEVVAALIVQDGKFMICQRPLQKSCPLEWEFPGGKIEQGETPEQALVRECQEELGITVDVGEAYTDTYCDYPDKNVHLTLYRCTIKEGLPLLLEHHDFTWVTAADMAKYTFIPGDIQIVEKLQKENL